MNESTTAEKWKVTPKIRYISDKGSVKSLLVPKHRATKEYGDVETNVHDF
jgi:hypothetical protein